MSESINSINPSLANTNNFTSSSPLILPIVILLYSAFQPAVIGIWYMVCLLPFSLIRIFVFAQFKGLSVPDGCNFDMILGKTLNPSVFISMFTLLFILMPMFIYSQFNIFVIIILLCYVVTSYSLTYNCYRTIKMYLFFDVVGGLFFGFISFIILHAIYTAMNKSPNYLFIASVASTEKCSMASSQNFVCKVYKNGQLISTPANIPGYSGS